MLLFGGVKVRHFGGIKMPLTWMRQCCGDHLKGWFIPPFLHLVFKFRLLKLILLFHLGCFFFCFPQLWANFLPHSREFETVPARSVEESSWTPYFGVAIGKQALFIPGEEVWVSMMLDILGQLGNIYPNCKCISSDPAILLLWIYSTDTLIHI